MLMLFCVLEWRNLENSDKLTVLSLICRTEESFMILFAVIPTFLMWNYSISSSYNSHLKIFLRCTSDVASSTGHFLMSPLAALCCLSERPHSDACLELVMGQRVRSPLHAGLWVLWRVWSHRSHILNSVLSPKLRSSHMLSAEMNCSANRKV